MSRAPTIIENPKRMYRGDPPAGVAVISLCEPPELWRPWELHIQRDRKDPEKVTILVINCDREGWPGTIARKETTLAEVEEQFRNLMRVPGSQWRTGE